MSYKYLYLNTNMPEKDEVLKRTPNPAAKELITKLKKEGVPIFLDRFAAQQPQCRFGLQGICCRMCQWGPCTISRKSTHGVCGKDMNLIVMGNLLRALVSGLAAHARHAHEIYLTIMAVRDGTVNIKIKGEDRVFEMAGRLGIEVENRKIEAIAGEIAEILLEDLGKMKKGELRLLEAYAGQENKDLWRRLDILPRSSAYEIMEALHMTTLGACSDWMALVDQELRSTLAYCYSTLFGTSLATEILYGIPRPQKTVVNFGVLKEDHVNILLHGHSPVMVEKILEKIHTPEIQSLARQLGAEGIVLGGMCCTGNELLARYGIPTVTNILGQELAIGTGAVDTVIVDMQCIIPGMKITADCFGTEIITTCRSNRIPGAVHVPFDPEDPGSLDDNALYVARSAVESFGRRKRRNIHIPDYRTEALTGWSYEAILEAFDGADRLVELLKTGKFRGICTIVGCNTPKVAYESGHVTIARELIADGILLTTTGCCSHALLNAGLCAPDAAEMTPHDTRVLLENLGIPPVLAVGGCVDNARSLRLFLTLAEAAGLKTHDMPFMFIGPEPGNEKTLGQGVTFLVHGISNTIGFPGHIPQPTVKPSSDNPEELERCSNDVADFFSQDGLINRFGAKVFTEPEPVLAAQIVKMHLHRKRLELRNQGWS
ncbi:carbon monoxide dehydrogenase 1 [bacterium BMS3Abin14]|nr:carbon monoxide dehydrogenase 1 [bacterium BMS3Abin14]